MFEYRTVNGKLVVNGEAPFTVTLMSTEAFVRGGTLVAMDGRLRPGVMVRYQRLGLVEFGVETMF